MVECSNKILKADSNTAGTIIINLRDILRQPRTETNEKEYSDNLRRLAPLLLCARPHRPLHAETIVQYWDSEIEEHLADSGLSGHGSALPNAFRLDSKASLAAPLYDAIGERSPSEGKFPLDKEVKLEDDSGSIRIKDEDGIAKIMEELGGYLDFSKNGSQLLGELGNLLGYSQGQFLTKSMKLVSPGISKLSTKLGGDQNLRLPTTPVKREGTPARGESPAIPGSQSSIGSSTVSDVWDTPRGSGSPASNNSTPDSRPPAAKVQLAPPARARDVRNDYPEPTPMKTRSRTWPKAPFELDDSPAPPTPTPSQKRAPLKAGTTGPAETRVFTLMATKYSHEKGTKRVKNSIERSLLLEESKTGFVYVFRRPNCAYVKIGYTAQSTVEKRMKGFERNCGYDPQLVYEVATENAKKVEVLVHGHLHKQRRRETLIYGACNDGKGCRTYHKEWFAVSDELAKSTVKAWADWMSQKPYDGDGHLASVWIEQVNRFNWNPREGAWREWTSIKIFKEIDRGLSKSEDKEYSDAKDSSKKYSVTEVTEVRAGDD